MDLYVDIIQYLTVWEFMLMGDFNAHTKALQNPLHNWSKDVFWAQRIDLELVGLHRMSNDALGPTTAHGRHLWQLLDLDMMRF